MKVVIQRVLHAKVEINNQLINKIDNGLVILVGFTYNDTLKDIDYIVNKIVNLRIFNDEFGIMNKSILDTCGSILSISQFTLYADTKKGRRPSYIEALNGEEAKNLYELFNSKLNNYITTKTGVFGADMQISLTNDGPVSIIIESR